MTLKVEEHFKTLLWLAFIEVTDWYAFFNEVWLFQNGKGSPYQVIFNYNGYKLVDKQ